MSGALTRYALYGTTLALAWFAVVNVLASAVVAWGSKRMMARLEHAPGSLWFVLRVLPAAIATLFVTAVFLPSYWLLEPREGLEGLAVTVIVAAGVGLLAWIAAAARGISAWYRAVRRTRAWMRTARPVVLPGTSVTAFELDIDTPLLALAGVVRPRLLVTRGLVAALTPDELAACVAHEHAHRRSHDNLKRLAMQLMPDALPITGTAAALERRWAAFAEHAADRHASAGDAQARCALASALLKVARLTPLESAVEPVSALVGGGDLASRVGRLLDENAAFPRSPHRRFWIAAAGAAAAAAVLYTPLLYAVHEATEILIRQLP